MTKKILLLASFIAFNSLYSQTNYLDFDGVNDNVTITGSENTVANATALTLSCNVFPKSTSTGFPNFDGLAGYRNETTFDFYIIQLSSTQIEARFRNSAGTAYTLTYNGLVMNQWNHLFLVYDGALLKLYSGATLAGSIAASGSVPATNTSILKIGLISYQAFNWYHNGYIDEVSLWNKGLSATEISAIIANNGDIANPAGETNLKLYYKFNQGIPYGNNIGLTTLTDETATSNGFLNNFALTGSSSNWGNQTLTNSTFNATVSSVYPNPTSNSLNFTGFNNITNIKIVDLSGRIIVDKSITVTQNTTLNVSELQSGIYLAVINENEKVKFIKK